MSSAPMPAETLSSYALAGLTLESGVRLPELAPSTPGAQADWTLRLSCLAATAAARRLVPLLERRERPPLAVVRTRSRRLRPPLFTNRDLPPLARAPHHRVRGRGARGRQDDPAPVSQPGLPAGAVAHATVRAARQRGGDAVRGDRICRRNRRGEVDAVGRAQPRGVHRSSPTTRSCSIRPSTLGHARIDSSRCRCTARCGCGPTPPARSSDRPRRIRRWRPTRTSGSSRSIRRRHGCPHRCRCVCSVCSARAMRCAARGA